MKLTDPEIIEALKDGMCIRNPVTMGENVYIHTGAGVALLTTRKGRTRVDIAYITRKDLESDDWEVIDE